MNASEAVWIDSDASPSVHCHFEAARRAVPMLPRPELERQLIHSLAAQVNQAQALKRQLGRLLELEATVAAMERQAPGDWDFLARLGLKG
jgi:hypothetical protein